MWDSLQDDSQDAPQFISFSQPQAMRCGPDAFDSQLNQGIMSFSQPVNYQDASPDDDDKFAVALVYNRDFNRRIEPMPHTIL